MSANISNVSVSPNRVTQEPPELPAAIAIGVLIILINGVIFYLFKLKPSLLHQPSNRILFSLAISDTISGMCIFLHTIAEVSSSLKWPRKQGPYIYRILTDIITNVVYICTILHLCATTLDRYISLLFPYNYQEKVTKKTALAMVLMIWLISCLTSFAQFCWLYRVMDGTITPEDGIILGRIEPVYSITVTVVLVIIPTITIGILYVRMFRETRKVMRATSNNKRLKTVRVELNVVRTFALMYIGFLILDFPYAIQRLNIDIHMAKGSVNSNLNNQLFQIFYYLRYLTSILNPVLYTFCKEDFRKVVRSLVQKYFNQSMNKGAFGFKFKNKESVKLHEFGSDNIKTVNGSPNYTCGIHPRESHLFLGFSFEDIDTPDSMRKIINTD